MHLAFSAALALLAGVLVAGAGAVVAGSEHAGAPFRVILAEFAGPTNRYPHNVLGEIPGWTSMTVVAAPCEGCKGQAIRLTAMLPEAEVFEDIEPRLWDVNGDGVPEIVVVESNAKRGARLVAWNVVHENGSVTLGRLASTHHIGTRFRWLAPVGIADFTGDGLPDIAYVETPHLGRILRIVTLQGDRLVGVASLAGLTNHRIGESYISGGLRDCGGGPEMMLASADWAHVHVVWYDRSLRKIETLPIAPFSGQESFDAALACN